MFTNRATKLESSNISSLARHASDGDYITEYDQWTWYAGQPQAPVDRHDFQLYWYDFHTGEGGKVVGETGYSWLELHEVSDAFNGEGDGNFYYVGLSDHDAAIAPHWSELKEAVDYIDQNTETFFALLPDERVNHSLKYVYTPSERLAAYLFWGQNPKTFKWDGE